MSFRLLWFVILVYVASSCHTVWGAIEFHFKSLRIKGFIKWYNNFFEKQIIRNNHILTIRVCKFGNTLIYNI